jgi:hypothetical protein
MLRISVVVDNDGMQKVQAVAQWLVSPPRLSWRWLPTDWPRANPLERAYGEGPEKCTRHHPRQRLRDLVKDGEWPVQAHGPWQYKLSRLYGEPEVTVAVENIAAEQQPKMAACVYESHEG